jgi:hypothetical protein
MSLTRPSRAEHGRRYKADCRSPGEAVGRGGRPALVPAHRPPGGQPPHRTLTGLTAAWGIGLLAAAAVQGAGAITGGLTFTSPASFAARVLIALAAEAILAALTIAWLHRSPAPGPNARSATPDPSLLPGRERSFWQQQNRRDLSPDGR